MWKSGFLIKNNLDIFFCSFLHFYRNFVESWEKFSTATNSKTGILTKCWYFVYFFFSLRFAFKHLTLHSLNVHCLIMWCDIEKTKFTGRMNVKFRRWLCRIVISKSLAHILEILLSSLILIRRKHTHTRREKRSSEGDSLWNHEISSLQYEVQAENQISFD